MPDEPGAYMAEVERQVAPWPKEKREAQDPKELGPAGLRALGHEPMPPLAAIRENCLQCCAGSPGEVRYCAAVTCPSWPFRMGTNPWLEKRKLSDEDRAARAERLRMARAAKRGETP